MLKYAKHKKKDLKQCYIAVLNKNCMHFIKINYLSYKNKLNY